jgi:hypothetical protein
MANKISLLKVPNQSFSVQLDDQRYVLQIKESNGSMSCSTSINEVVVSSGVLIVTNSFLIPFPYLEGEGGNFVFTSDNENIIYFENFESSQFLFYLSPEEVSAVR